MVQSRDERAASTHHTERAAVKGLELKNVDAVGLLDDLLIRDEEGVIVAKELELEASAEAAVGGVTVDVAVDDTGGGIVVI